MVSGDVNITRSGELEDGFSTWNAIHYGGVTEVMTSAVGGDDAGRQLSTLDARIQAAGGTGLKEDGIFNNAYVVAGGDTEANRAWIQEFNASFSAWYEARRRRAAPRSSSRHSTGVLPLRDPPIAPFLPDSPGLARPGIVWPE